MTSHVHFVRLFRLVHYYRSVWCLDPDSELDGGISHLISFMPRSLSGSDLSDDKPCEELFIGASGVTPGKMKGCGERGSERVKLQRQLSLKCHKLFFRRQEESSLLLRMARAHTHTVALIFYR